MRVSIPLMIATRYLFSRNSDRFGRLVTLLAAIGITLGVMALIVVLSVMNGLETHQKKNVLENIPHAIVSPLKGNIKLADNTLPPIPEFVTHTAPIDLTNVIMQVPGKLSAVKLIGVESFTNDPLLLNISQPFAQVLPEGEFKLVISSLLANQFKLSVGDKVRLILTENSQYTPFGRVPLQRLFTISAIYDYLNENGGADVFTNLKDIGRLLRIPDGEVQGIRLFLDDPFKIKQLTAYFSEKIWKISDWREEKGEFFQAVRMEKNMMGLLISLIIIVAVSNIITSLSLMVLDKQGEIAILQTQGLTKRQITAIFILQGMLVGVLGTLIGVILGTIAGLNLQPIISILNEGVVLPTALDPVHIVFVATLSILLSFLSTIYPAYRAAKVEPAEALRYE